MIDHFFFRVPLGTRFFALVLVLPQQLLTLTTKTPEKNTFRYNATTNQYIIHIYEYMYGCVCIGALYECKIPIHLLKTKQRIAQTQENPLRREISRTYHAERGTTVNPELPEKTVSFFYKPQRWLLIRIGPECQSEMNEIIKP